MIAKILILLYIFSIPLLGRFIDFPETIFFYGFPLLIFAVLLFAKKRFLFNSKLIFAQISLIVLFFISTLLSKNIGTSFNYFFLFLNSLFIFNLAILILKKSEFSKSFLAFSLAYSVVFILNKIHFIAIPIDPVRGDNFILQVWGHSNLSDLIVLSIPIWIRSMTRKNYYIYLIPFSIVIITLYLTQSRSSLIALLVGLIFYKTRKLVVNSRLIKTIIVLIILGISYITINGSIHSKSLLQDRLDLWQQSITGATESFFFGNGPGTFFLLNYRFQEKNQITYFAHNSLLGFLCENGVIFTLLAFNLIVLGLSKSAKKNNLYFVISLIAITNSLFDATWNSPGIFIISLFFIFYELNKCLKPDQRQFNKYFYLIFTLILFIFLGTTLSEVFFKFKNYQASVFLNPFNLKNRNTIIGTPNIDPAFWQKNLNETLRYFPNEPTTYLSLISAQKLPISENYYLKLIELMPKENGKYLLTLAKYYFENGQQDKLISLINTSVIGRDQSGYLESKELAVIYYKLAVDIFANQHHDSTKYFELAVKTLPTQSHFHIELANVYWYTDHRDKAIEQLKTICPQYGFPKTHCLEYLNAHQNNNFDFPGIYLPIF